MFAVFNQYSVFYEVCNMSDSLREYVLRIIAAAIICALAMAIISYYVLVNSWC